MTTTLYLTPLPKSQATQPGEQSARAQLAAQGLVDQSGLVTERVSTENVDVQVRGQFRLAQFTEKAKKELRSLSESDISALPLSGAGDKDGYYEVSDVSVNPAHETTDLAAEYRIGLTQKGTRQTEWRAVRTNSETIGTGLTGGGTDFVAAPSAAVKPRWFDAANGSEVATVQQTKAAELGDVDLYDPDNATGDDPTLIYGLDLSREGRVDVRVWDDRDRNKYTTFSDDTTTVSTDTHVGSATVSSSAKVNQWYHAYHPGWEFEGVPVVDNGLLRVGFDEQRRRLLAWEWDGSAWSGIGIDHGDYWLWDADVTQIGPSMCEVFAEFEDRSTGSIDAAVIRVQRGIDRAVVRDPENSSIPNDLETMLTPIASDQDSDPQPSHGVISRQEVK